MINDVPDRVWPDQVWLEDEFGDGHDDQFQYGSWDCRNVYGYQEPYLRATPARLHAEELVEALREIVNSGGAYGLLTYAQRVDKLARDALARIEQETT